MILGIDEVGRGALAGPVMLGGVLLDLSYPRYTYIFEDDKGTFADYDDLKFVRDSKKLKMPQRLVVRDLVQSRGVPNLVLQASNRLIDQFGIGVCLSHLVSITVQHFARENPTLDVIIDGKISLLNTLNEMLLKCLCQENSLSFTPTPTFTLKLETKPNPDLFSENSKAAFTITRENFADDKYLSIALASNLAKVERDNLMKNLAQEFPEFGWERNVGYGTVHHRQIIRNTSNNAYLRQTFLSRIRT
jgi:ribonuclease HII